MKKMIGVFSVLILVIDQIVKYMVASNFELYNSIKVIPNFFYLTYATNDGAAFGIFEDGRWYFIVLSVIAIISVLSYILSDRRIEKGEAVSYALILGGIVGNLADRIIHGYVIDYLDFYLFGVNFPIFNIADACIVIGVIIVIYNLMIKGVPNEVNNSRRRGKREQNR